MTTRGSDSDRASTAIPPSILEKQHASFIDALAEAKEELADDSPEGEIAITKMNSVDYATRKVAQDLEESVYPGYTPARFRHSSAFLGIAMLHEHALQQMLPNSEDEQQRLPKSLKAFNLLTAVTCGMLEALESKTIPDDLRDSVMSPSEGEDALATASSNLCILVPTVYSYTCQEDALSVQKSKDNNPKGAEVAEELEKCA